MLLCNYIFNLLYFSVVVFYKFILKVFFLAVSIDSQLNRIIIVVFHAIMSFFEIVISAHCSDSFSPLSFPRLLVNLLIQF